jgi:hypothetical protein
MLKYSASAEQTSKAQAHRGPGRDALVFAIN